MSEETNKLPQGLSIAGMVLGIVGVLFSVSGCTAIPGILCGVIGLVLSAIAFKKCGEGTQGGKGMAIAGLATGIIAIIYGIYIMVVLAAVLNEVGGALDEFDKALDLYNY